MNALSDELKETKDKKTADRKRYDELKVKYKALSEKAKIKGVNEIPELDDSQGFMTLFRSQSSSFKETQSKLDTFFK